MEFLLLWSGDVKGMKKARIAGFENKVSTLGSWQGGKLYLPDPAQLRNALPYRFMASYDRAINWHGLPQIWMDATNGKAPLTIRLQDSTLKRNLVTLYLQPLTE